MSEGMTRRRFVRIGAVAAGTVVLGGSAVQAATYAPEADRPSWRMGEGDMKALVVYGTGTGCTAGIAEQIGATLSDKGVTAEVVSAENAGDPTGYDAVIVGSGVRAGTWHAPVRAWVENHADTLKEVPVAFFTCGLTLAQYPEKTDEVRAYTDALIESTVVRPLDIGTFAGWNEPKRFSFIERTIMKMMKAPQGDFRDMEAVAAWTAAMAPRLEQA